MPIAVLMSNQLQLFDIESAVPKRADHLRCRPANQDDVPPRPRFQWHDEPPQAGPASSALIPKRQGQQPCSDQPDAKSPESEQHVPEKELG